MAVDQAGDVGFGLTGHQVRWAEFLQYTIVIIFIDLSLIINPA